MAADTTAFCRPSVFQDPEYRLLTTLIVGHFGAQCLTTVAARRVLVTRLSLLGEVIDIYEPYFRIL